MNWVVEAVEVLVIKLNAKVTTATIEHAPAKDYRQLANDLPAEEEALSLCFHLLWWHNEGRGACWLNSFDFLLVCPRINERAALVTKGGRCEALAWNPSVRVCLDGCDYIPLL